MADESPQPPRHPPGKHRHRSVTEGIEMANEFFRSRLTMSEFARQRGVSFRMVKYWSTRARQLAAASSPDLVQVAEVSPTGGITPAAVPRLPAAPAPIAAVAPTLSSPPTIELRLPNGVRIGIAAGFSAETLAQVIACVGGRPC